MYRKTYNKYKRTRKNKKGGVAPHSNNLFSDRYNNAIENIRTEYPDIFNMIQNLRTNGVRPQDMPQLDNAIRTLRRRIYLSPPNSSMELEELLIRIEEIREEIAIQLERDFRDTFVGYGGNYRKKIIRKSMKKKTRRHR
jgi:hypothetical protein